MFAGKALAFPANISYPSAFWGRLLALPANIRLGWKGLPETNTLTYYENP
jgi:hypothetical protein